MYLVLLNVGTRSSIIDETINFMIFEDVYYSFIFYSEN